MELFEQIRCKYEHGGGTIRGIAKKLRIPRRMAREAVQQKALNEEDCLEALTKKPVALAGSTPLDQLRAQGRWLSNGAAGSGEEIPEGDRLPGNWNSCSTN